MIPDFLSQYKDALKKHARNSILISEDEIGTLIPDATAITQSKYLGHFFIPKTMTFPKGTDGNFLLPTIQINFEEIPELTGFPNEGLLQVFLPQHANFDKADICIQYISKEQLQEPHITDFSFLTEEMYQHHFFKNIYKLSFEKDISWASATDSQYLFRWDEIPENETLADYLEELSWEDEDAYDDLYELFTGDSMGSKIGGYGYFPNGDLRAISHDIKEHVLLLQIDGSDENIFSEEQDIYFHLFISKTDLLNKNFSNVIVDWQITD
ncbi:DUF1963 domain-containing protein [Kordia sp.]|uniref:DUF1963 domain-containing protein n=1 Tax=Kordia sp. TaxID=1965332 RepID=UPI003B5C507B